MSNNETGGPAFPRPASEAHQHGMHSPQEGMTLRDYFAAKAMQAEISRSGYSGTDFMIADAKRAYYMADVMLKARNVK
jgi:hypothetical protein